MNAVMISIKPRWCEMIARGAKTIEVRKTRPNLNTPFKCYIYCTKSGNLCFWKSKLYTYADDHSHNLFDKCGNGKIIGEFVCDNVEEIVLIDTPVMSYIRVNSKASMTITDDTCLNIDELLRYADGKMLYGWHISDLLIYDKPKELSEFTKLRKTKFGYEPVRLECPPQSWCYVEELEDNK